MTIRSGLTVERSLADLPVRCRNKNQIFQLIKRWVVSEVRQHTNTPHCFLDGHGVRSEGLGESHRGRGCRFPRQAWRVLDSSTHAAARGSGGEGGRLLGGGCSFGFDSGGRRRRIAVDRTCFGSLVLDAVGVFRSYRKGPDLGSKARRWQGCCLRQRSMSDVVGNKGQT
ncbi:hypothetical protein BDW62DRAFT_183395 [Aspergillus aurantiobrunneus]